MHLPAPISRLRDSVRTLLQSPYLLGNSTAPPKICRRPKCERLKIRRPWLGLNQECWQSLDTRLLAWMDGVAWGFFIISLLVISGPPLISSSVPFTSSRVLSVTSHQALRSQFGSGIVSWSASLILFIGGLKLWLNNRSEYLIGVLDYLV